MRKLLFFVVLSFICVSCSKTPEQKAKQAVKDYLQKNLNDAKSYESVEFGKVDSVFSSFDESKEGVELKLKEDVLSKRVVELSNRIDVAENNSELKKIIEENKELTQKRKDLVDTIFYKSIKYKGTFSGYKINHKYRAKNKMGAMVLTEDCFILDKNFAVTKVL
jgi:disulfide oxidoreductase YuzD